MTRSFLAAVCTAGALAAGPASADQPQFEDVVRNLRNPDAKVRMSALRLLREAQHHQATISIAPLINDPVNEIQLEAIATELSFFLTERIPERRRVGFVLEVRNSGGAPAAFDLGPHAVRPKAAPPELVQALLKAVDDETARIRVEAMYAVGVVGVKSLPAEAESELIKALDHYDPAVRAAAARVAGRLTVKSAGEPLIKAINDSSREVRYAAMRALGELREPLAVQALTEQLTYYGKGEGASLAIQALARIAHPSTVPVLSTYLTHKEPFLRRSAAEGLGRIGDTSQLSVLLTGAGNDLSSETRAAMAFALQKLGHRYVARLADFLSSDDMVQQVQDYFIELGPTVEKDLLPMLHEPDEVVQARVAEILGSIGSEASIAALERLKDRDRRAAAAADRALERIKLRQG